MPCAVGKVSKFLPSNTNGQAVSGNPQGYVADNCNNRYKRGSQISEVNAAEFHQNLALLNWQPFFFFQNDNVVPSSLPFHTCRQMGAPSEQKKVGAVL